MNQSKVEDNLIETIEVKELQASTRKITISIIIVSIVTLVMLILMIIFIVNYSKSSNLQSQKFQELEKWRQTMANFPYKDYNFSGGIVGGFELKMDSPPDKIPLRKLAYSNSLGNYGLDTFSNNYIYGLESLILQNGQILKFQNNFLENLNTLVYKMTNTDNLTFFINNYLPGVKELQLTSPISQFRANTINLTQFTIQTKLFVYNIFDSLANLTIIGKNLCQMSHNYFQKVNRLNFGGVSSVSNDQHLIFTVSLNVFSAEGQLVHTFDNSNHSCSFSSNKYQNLQSIVFEENANVFNFNANILPKLKTFTFKSSQPHLISFSLNSFPELIELNIPEESQVNTFSYNSFPKLPNLNLSSKGIYQFVQNQLTSVTSLDLSHNDLHALQIQDAPLLQTLDISHSGYLFHLKNIQLPSLETLIFEESPFLQLLEKVTFHKLKYLRGGFCNLMTLMNVDVPNLLEAELEYNNLNYFELVLPKLVNLNLSNNRITSLNIPNSVLLQRLQIQNNKLPVISLKFPLLKYLNLSSNDLVQFTNNDYTTLQNLEYLNLNNNPLKQFDISASNLTVLEMRNTTLTAIIQIKAANLKLLDLRNNPTLTSINNINSNIEEILIDNYPVTQFRQNTLKDLKKQNNKFNFSNIRIFSGNQMDFSMKDFMTSTSFASPQLIQFKNNNLIFDAFVIQQSATSLKQIKNNQLHFALQCSIHSPYLQVFDNNTITVKSTFSIKNTTLNTFTNNRFYSIRDLSLTQNKIVTFKNNVFSDIHTLLLTENQLDDTVVDELIQMNMEKILLLDISKNKIQNKQEALQKLQQKYPAAIIVV